MPDGSFPVRPYKSAPSPQDERISGPLRRNMPEEIPHLSWSPPDFQAEGHKIVATFEIDAKKRPERAYIPCALCSGNHPKYLKGAVLWSPDGQLRIIGHVCARGADKFGEAAFSKLEREKHQALQDRLAFEWLEIILPHLPELRVQMEATRVLAVFLEEQQRRFFTGVRPLAEVLARSASREDGRLFVTSSTSRRELINAVSLGRMQGLQFLRRPKLPRSRDTHGILQALAMIPEGPSEDILMRLIDRGDAEITRAAGSSRRQSRRGLGIAQACTDATRFTSEKNLDLLAAWGGDPRNAFRFRLERRPTIVTIVLEDRSRAVIRRDWPESPDVELLRDIIDRGASFDKLLQRTIGS